MQLNFDYYYGDEAEQYSFYRIPKVLVNDVRFSAVSLDAKFLYGLLLDRMALSVKRLVGRKWSRVYHLHSCGCDGKPRLCRAESKKLLNELDIVRGIGLIERKRRGLGKPNVIYVKKFISKEQISPTSKELVPS